MSEPGKRYREAFAAAEARGDGPLVFPFLIAGFPTPAETPDLVRAALRGGAAGFEIGVPFSDPIADGPTHQEAYNVALDAGATVDTALDAVRIAREAGPDTALTLMGYLNPFLAWSEAQRDSTETDDRPGQAVARPLEPLARRAAEAGADGIIVVDLPADESEATREVFAQHGISLIYFLAPTSTEERIASTVERASGFIYVLSLTGVTGERNQLPDDMASFVQRVRTQTDTPLAVGFGISRREHVEAVGDVAHAAIIGSALTATIASTPAEGRPQAVERFLEVVTGRRSEETA